MKLTPSLIGKEHVNKKITIYGIVIHTRDFGKKKFVIITDGKKNLQVVLKTKEKIRRGYSLKVYGLLKEETRAPNNLELQAEEYEILSKSIEDYLDIWSIRRMSSNKKRELRPITLRLPEYFYIFEFYSKVVEILREYLIKSKLLEIYTPKVVILGTESGSEVFSILYFNRDAYLAQSPQLYKQMLMSSGVVGVFEVGTYYRAEKSRSTRHLTEFRGLDVELNYIEDYNEIMDFIEDMFKYLFKKLELNIKEIPRIKFEEVKKILKEKYNKYLKNDLDSEGEQLIHKYVKENYDSDFVFVTDFPYSARPFYTMKYNEYTYSFDLIYKGLEIISGSKREHRYNILINQIKDKGINPERMKYYLEVFKHGIPPHGGFGLGLDRLVKQMLDKKDIKDVVLFPRDPDILEP